MTLHAPNGRTRHRVGRNPQAMTVCGRWLVVGRMAAPGEAPTCPACSGRAEAAYAAVADELNDGDDRCLVLTDLDAREVAAAEVYARSHDLPWPPQPGDYDRYWERAYNRL